MIEALEAVQSGEGFVPATARSLELKFGIVLTLPLVLARYREEQRQLDVLVGNILLIYHVSAGRFGGLRVGRPRSVDLLDPASIGHGSEYTVDEEERD